MVYCFPTLAKEGMRTCIITQKLEENALDREHLHLIKKSETVHFGKLIKYPDRGLAFSPGN
jgi:hypothetical protein